LPENRLLLNFIPSHFLGCGLCVSASQDGAGDYARKLASNLQLPFITENTVVSAERFNMMLCFDSLGAALISVDQSMTPIRVDFTCGKIAHRRKFGGGKRQLIAKAVGIKSGILPYVIDATAGLGKDSFVLASLGCRVTLLERSPIIAELLKSGLAQAETCAETAEITSRMNLIQQDAISWLQNATHDIADVIYLDPMFPHREKSALVKKEMRLFRPIVGDDKDSASLLSAALQHARCRVVVKRPRKAAAIPGPLPSYVLKGKSSRYDIYALKSLEALKQDS